MKKIHILLLFALWFVVGSCATSYISSKQIMGIQQGMSRQEVERVLGKPDFRRFDDDMEEWEFRRNNISAISVPSTVVIIQFVNGGVVSMNTFKEYEGCHTPGPTVVAPCVMPNEREYHEKNK